MKKLTKVETFAYIHCKCRPDKKAARLSEFYEYIVYGWLYDKREEARCKFCGKFVQYYMPWELPEHLKPDETNP